MPIEQRRVDRLGDDELFALEANPTIGPVDRAVITQEIAVRARVRARQAPAQNIRIIGVDVPLGDLIMFSFKWFIASLPLALCIVLLWMFVVLVIPNIFRPR